MNEVFERMEHDNRTFWVVWSENGGIPTFKHYSPDAAKQEAERLSRSMPGKRFWILESRAVCVKSDVAWTTPDPSDACIPF